MVQHALERREIVVGSTRNVAVSFAGKLDTGELVTGTPTVVEVDTTDLTLGNKAVSTTELTISGETVPIGEAVQLSITGHLLATGSYTILITATTDATPAQVLPLGVILDVVEVGG